jgi:hypothetical protein
MLEKCVKQRRISVKRVGGSGMIDIATKTGEKLEDNFLEIDNKVSFFTLIIKVSNQN